MVSLYCTILTLLYILGALLGKRDICSPRFLFNAYAWLKNVPYFWQIGNTYGDALCFKYFIIKVIGWMMVNVGISFYQKYFSRKWEYYTDESSTPAKDSSLVKYSIVAWGLFIVGFIMKAYIVVRIGGINYVLSHLQGRGTMLADFGYLNTFSTYFVNSAVLSAEYFMCKTGRKGSRISFLIITALSALTLIVFGARKPVLMMFVRIFICYHYLKHYYRLRDLFRPKTIAAILLLVLFMLMMPMLRYYENSNIYLTPGAWVDQSLDSVNSIFREFSYLTGDMYTFENFDLSNYWGGKVYLNIFTQWIPRSLFPNKPPMDDGMYLYNMMRGVSVTQNMPTVSLPYQTSVPFTLEGSLYVNFGWLGVILGCLFVGMLYQYVYKVMNECDYNIMTIFIYQTIIFEFTPSVLHTTSPLIAIAFMAIITVPLLHIRIKKRLRYPRGNTYVNT